MTKKILVTGANGQLGSEIREISVSADSTFIFIDIDDLDLTVRDEVLAYLKVIRPDIIVNCAAYTAVDKAEEETKKAMQLNAFVPEILAEYCETTNCKLIHISTDYVFSGETFFPLKETSNTDPKSVYAKSKLAGEKALENCSQAIVVRTSWLYSSYGNNFIKSMIRLFKERDELKIVYDQIGSPTYAADLADAILQIINQSESKFVPGIYQYSNEGVASWFDLAYEIRELTNASCTLIPIETKDYPLPATRPWYAVMSKDKIKQEYGIIIPHWKSSLKKCLNKIN